MSWGAPILLLLGGLWLQPAQAVAPQTMVTRRKKGTRTFLTGYAYRFYPRDIEVKWVRNGVDMPWESSEILPNPDGTYQAKKTVEVQEGDDEKMYKYEVYHSSLPDTVTVMYEEKSPPLGVIIGGVIGALVGVGLLAAAIWFVYLRRNMQEEKSPSMGVVIVSIIGALVGIGLLASVIWIVYLRKKTSGQSTYTAAKQDPAPGDSSSSQSSA